MAQPTDPGPERRREGALWARLGPGRARAVAMALQRWLTAQGFVAYVEVRGYRSWDGQWHRLSPPLDVLALRGGELSAYRVALLSPQPPAPLHAGLLPPGLGEDPVAVDPALFTALGEALFALAYAPRASLVVPWPGVSQRLRNLVQELPLGLLAFDEDHRFETLEPASPVHLQGTEAEALLSAVRRGDLWYYSMA